jgi:hypothetical protein
MRLSRHASIAEASRMSDPRAARRKPARSKIFKSSTSETAESGYVRVRDLHRLLPLWPGETEIRSASDHARLLARLRRALRAERRLGLGGHWTYDLARHAQLLRAYRAEVADYLRKTGRAKK